MDPCHIDMMYSYRNQVLKQKTFKNMGYQGTLVVVHFQSFAAAALASVKVLFLRRCHKSAAIFGYNKTHHLSEKKTCMLSYLLFMFIHPCHFFNFISSCLSRSYIYVSYQFPKFNEGVSVQNLTWQSWGRLTRRNPESRMLVKNKKPDCPMPILTRCTCLNLHPPTTHPVPSSQALHDMTPVLHSRCA